MVIRPNKNLKTPLNESNNKEKEQIICVEGK